LSVTDQDRGRLQEWLDDPAMPPECADRLRIVLLAAEGWLNVEIAAQLEVSVATVAKWRDRFALDGMDGLLDRPRSGRPRQVDRPAIVAATLQPPAAPGVTRWSSRELGRKLGVGEATVARAWREFGVRPRLGGAFTFTVQPELTAVAVEVIGVCLTPRARTLALIVEGAAPLYRDRTGDRAATARPACSLPGGSDRPVPTRSATSHATAARCELREFLRHLARAYPSRRVHLVLDGPGARRTLLASMSPDATMLVHLTVSTRMWLNLLDVWSWMMARDAEADGSRTASRIRGLVDAGRPTSWIRQPAESAEQASTA
jgi:transposase